MKPDWTKKPEWITRPEWIMRPKWIMRPEWIMRPLTREPVGQQLHGVDTHIQLIHVMLAEITNPQVSVGVAESTARLQISQKEFQESCFTRSIITNLKFKLTITNLKFKLIKTETLVLVLTPCSGRGLMCASDLQFYWQALPSCTSQ